MPTAPLHQGCVGNPLDDLDRIVQLLRPVHVVISPSESPDPRMSTRTQA